MPKTGKKAQDVTVEAVKREAMKALRTALPVAVGGGLTFSLAVILTRFLPGLYNRLSVGGRLNPQAVATGIMGALGTFLSIPLSGKYATYLMKGSIGAIGVGLSRIVGDATLPYMERVAKQKPSPALAPPVAPTLNAPPVLSSTRTDRYRDSDSISTVGRVGLGTPEEDRILFGERV